LLLYFLPVFLIEKKKALELEGLRSLTIKVTLHKLSEKAKNSKTVKFDNVARNPTPDPRNITVVDEEWFERRCNSKKGY
jgi:hypothetical protein